MQNKKNKKQNGGSNEGSVIFTYVLLTFVIGFILYCVYWCYKSGPVNCKHFFDYISNGEWDIAFETFLKNDYVGQGIINEGKSFLGF